ANGTQSSTLTLTAASSITATVASDAGTIENPVVNPGSITIDYAPIDESYTPPLVVNNAIGSTLVDDLFDANQDGYGDVTISKNFNLELTSGGEPLVYTNGLDGSLIAKTESGAPVFTVTPVVDGNDVNYKFVVFAPLELVTVTDYGLGVLSEGGNKSFYWLLDDGALESGNNSSQQPANTSVIVRGKFDDGSYANVNGNNNGMGSTAVGGQTIQDGEWVELTYTTAQTSVQIGIGQGSNNAIPDANTPIEIKVNGGSIVTFYGSALVGGKLTLNARDFGVTEISTVEVSATDQNLVINSISTSTTTTVDDEVLNFTYVGEDTDGDTTSGDFSVLITSDGSSSSTVDSTGELIRGTDADDISLGGTAGGDILYGYDGADALSAGHDVLIGGAGNDILSGGIGADEFIWNDGDTGTDTVNDFSVVEGDVLNLSDLLDPGTTLEIGGADNLDNYLKATFDNTSNTTTIDVYTGGDANSSGIIDQSILINGDVSDLNSLIGTNNLIVDQ
ncbi:calcium-binding protein, partial [Cycloclasticus pugetii]